MAKGENQDLIKAVGELRETIERLIHKVEELEETVGKLFNAFDPQYGETLRQLLEAAEKVAAGGGRPGRAGPRRKKR